MEEFEIEVREVLSCRVRVVAQDEVSALRLVEELYGDESIVLVADDFECVDFDCVIV